ncbi:HD family hydrolase [Salmonella enterica]|nr:HD family hydrolase [Salmonella enterica]EHQ6953836.1 HD family hydrolase [Salmonella enterica]
MSFIQTLSGKQFDYLSATIDDIDIEDIAVALSNICRFSGHLPEFYSVAQHSVLCSQLVSPEFAFEALMHDAAEAYCQDIPAPLKALLPDYREIEKRTDQLIRFKFGLPLEEASVVKYADLTMLATERRDLDIDDSIHWVILEGIPPTDLFEISPLRPGQAFGMFMERFKELTEL